MSSINAFKKLSKCKKSLSSYTNNSRISLARCTTIKSNTLHSLIGNPFKLPTLRTYSSTFSRSCDLLQTRTIITNTTVPTESTSSNSFIPNNPKTKAFSFSSSFSSSSNNSTTKSDSIVITTIPKNNNNGRINLIPLIPESTLQTIRTLPEVEQVLYTLQCVQQEQESNNDSHISTTTAPITPTKSTLFDGLERASQIFQHVGETEYKSILLLKATLLSQHCHYDQVIEILTTLLPSSSTSTSTYTSTSNDFKEMQYTYHDFIVMSNLTKMHWYNGSFDQGLEYATIMNDIAPTLTSLSSHQTELDNMPPFCVYLHQGCSMNSKALCTLLSSSTNKATKKVYDVDILQIQNEKDDINNVSLSSSIYSDPLTLQEMNDAHTTMKMASKILLNAFHQRKNNNTTSSSLSNVHHQQQQQQRLNSQLGLASASSFCNQGIIDLLHVIKRNQVQVSTFGGSISSSSTNSIVNRIPIDSAMNSWRKGINIIDELLQNRHELDAHHEYVAKDLKAKLYCNMAWTILNISKYDGGGDGDGDGDSSSSSEGGKSQLSLKEDELKIASEYSSLALKLYDEIIKIGVRHNLGDYESLKPIMGRALDLVATCYVKAGSAVTAEGLLQSAMDLYKEEINEEQSLQSTCPLNQLDARSVYVTYATLCKNWEKREADAKKNAEIALKINEENFVHGWKGVSGIYSGLSFFAVTDF